MNIKLYSYRFASEIFNHESLKTLKEEICEACSSCPAFMYKGKSSNQTEKDIVQQLLNQYLKAKLTYKNWQPEPLITASDIDDSLRGDFFKQVSFISDDGVEQTYKVQVEVEFGNAASYYRDLFKFQRSFTNNKADICVLILPSASLAKRIDSGLADFQKAVRELPYSKLSTTVPILVIGLSDEDSEFDIKPYFYDSELVTSTLSEHVELRDRFLKSYIEFETDNSKHLLKISKNYYTSYMNAINKCKNLNEKIREENKEISKVETIIRNAEKDIATKKKEATKQKFRDIKRQALQTRAKHLSKIESLEQELSLAKQQVQNPLAENE